MRYALAMAEQFELKKISTDGVTGAIERAEHYRLLNDPEQAESICLDVLEVDKDNSRTLIVLVLSLTDQFGSSGSAITRRAKDCVAKLAEGYDRAYYSGLVEEREGRAYLKRGGMSRSFAYESLREAMQHYEQAESLRKSGVDDAILRWNACARTIEREGLEPQADESVVLLE